MNAYLEGLMKNKTLQPLIEIAIRAYGRDNLNKIGRDALWLLTPLLRPEFAGYIFKFRGPLSPHLIEAANETGLDERMSPRENLVTSWARRYGHREFWKEFWRWHPRYTKIDLHSGKIQKLFREWISLPAVDITDLPVIRTERWLLRPLSRKDPRFPFLGFHVHCCAHIFHDGWHTMTFGDAITYVMEDVENNKIRALMVAVTGNDNVLLANNIEVKPGYEMEAAPIFKKLFNQFHEVWIADHNDIEIKGDQGCPPRINKIYHFVDWVNPVIKVREVIL